MRVRLSSQADMNRLHTGMARVPHAFAVRDVLLTLGALASVMSLATSVLLLQMVACLMLCGAQLKLHCSSFQTHS